MTKKSTTHQLIVLQRAANALAETRDLKEIKGIRDKAEAARKYAASAALGLEVQNLAAELKLRAERRAGELLAGLKLHGGDRKLKPTNQNLKLADLGIDHNQSARWQREAAIPDVTFEQYVQQTQAARREITAQGLLRLHRLSGRQRPINSGSTSEACKTNGHSGHQNGHRARRI